MRSHAWLVLLAVSSACNRAPPSERTQAQARAAESAPVATESKTLFPASSSSAAAASSAGAAPSTRPHASAAAVPSALVASPPVALPDASTGLRGPVAVADDAAWLRRLASAPIVDARWNGGGSSVTLRVTFDDGKRAVLKAEQSLSNSNHRGEIAAYHVDRLLGFGRTAAVVGRRVPRALVEQAASDDAQRGRIATEVKSRGDVVEAAMIAWHDGPLADDTPPPAVLAAGPAPSTELAPRVAAWSDLHVFDVLIDNTDRWSGGNVLAKGRGGALVFLDNASSFLPGRARQGAWLEKTIAPVCRFAAPTVSALRALARKDHALSRALAASLAKDPLAPVLGPTTLEAIDARVTALVRHVDACITAHGESAVILPAP